MNIEKGRAPEHERIMKDFLARKDALLVNASEDEQMEKFIKMNDFGSYLDKKYPNARDYELWHVLVGSGISPRKNFDFPGEDSVEKFLNDLLK